jgi:hypothetical protein
MPHFSSLTEAERSEGDSFAFCHHGFERDSSSGLQYQRV